MVLTIQQIHKSMNLCTIMVLNRTFVPLHLCIVICTTTCKCANGCITMSEVVVRPYRNLTMGKCDGHIKLSLSSLTQKFIYYYTFKVVIRRKKESMKTELPMLAGQRETCH